MIVVFHKINSRVTIQFHQIKSLFYCQMVAGGRPKFLKIFMTTPGESTLVLLGSPVDAPSPAALCVVCATSWYLSLGTCPMVILSTGALTFNLRQVLFSPL